MLQADVHRIRSCLCPEPPSWPPLSNPSARSILGFPGGGQAIQEARRTVPALQRGEATNPDSIRPSVLHEKQNRQHLLDGEKNVLLRKISSFGLLVFVSFVTGKTDGFWLTMMDQLMLLIKLSNSL